MRNISAFMFAAAVFIITMLVLTPLIEGTPVPRAIVSRCVLFVALLMIPVVASFGMFLAIKMSSRGRYLAVLLVPLTWCVLWAWCYGFIGPASLIGSYACRYSYGTETLTLNDDGTYVQNLPAVAGPHRTNTGKWTFDSANGELVLQDAVIIDDGFGRPRSDLFKGTGGLPVHRLLYGGMAIMVNDDLGLEFLRTNHHG